MKKDRENVLLFFHGTEKALILKDGSSTEALSISGKNKAGNEIGKISRLKKKTIKNLYLFSCNTGYVGKNGEGKNSNVAKEFLKRTKNKDATVYAMDGSISYGNMWTLFTGNYEARVSNKQEHFEELTGGKREPKGWIKFQKGKSPITTTLPF